MLQDGGTDCCKYFERLQLVHKRKTVDAHDDTTIWDYLGTTTAARDYLGVIAHSNSLISAWLGNQRVEIHLEAECLCIVVQAIFEKHMLNGWFGHSYYCRPREMDPRWPNMDLRFVR